MDMAPLRDRAQTTRLLVLAALQETPGATLSQVAAGLGITVQAVSAHGKTLVAQGLLENDAGTFLVTPKGLQAIHEGLRGLRHAVDRLTERLSVIHVTSAVAAAAIEAGQEVALRMQDGDLAAYPDAKGPSRGVARHAARKGDEVIVGELKGMVELQPGRLHILTVPGPDEGGIRRVDRRATLALLRGLPKPGRTGAHGTGARILARELADAGAGPLHFEFAADRACFNAAERGLDVRLWASRDQLPELMETVRRLNLGTIRRVPVEVVEAPEGGARPARNGHAAREAAA